MFAFDATAFCGDLNVIFALLHPDASEYLAELRAVIEAHSSRCMDFKHIFISIADDSKNVHSKLEPASSYR